MIDLNGHKLNNIKLEVNKDVTLTLTGTEGSYVDQVYVRKGGSFVIDSDANAGFNTIFVEDSAQLAVSDGAKVTAEQLTVIASVADDGTTTTSVKLATGMKLGGLTYHRQNNSGALKLGNLLDVTRQALRREDNGNYLDLYKEYGSMGYSVALTVVEHTDADHKYGSGTGKCEECGKPCEHGGDINTDTGICSICGAVVSVALYTDGDGNLQYVDTDELDSLLNEYNGSGTIKLFKDYSKPSAQYDLYGELTIDLNGRQFKIRSITPCKNGKLTIKNSGNPVMLGCNVYPTSDPSYAGGTLIIDGDVVLDTSIYVYDSSTVILKDGTYTAGLYARDSKTLYDMLGECKAFFKTDGTLFNASVKEISSSVTLIVKDHSHTYVDGKCGCGYVCTHSDVDIDTGKCTECEYQYAAVIVKDGAVASVYEENEMGAAFEAADSDANTGCTLRVYKNYTGSYTTLSGKFTLWIAEKANVGTLTVSGDITVTGSGKNNSIYGDFNVANGGKLTFDENCGAMGTVSVGAGTFDCYYSLGTTLNINDASSNVILHGGIFRKICYNGGGDRANAEILTLLAENRMFMKYPNAETIDGSKTLLKDGLATVFVTSHEDHSYDSTTGKCTICGKRCGHTDVDSKTGVCSTCKYQLTAGISGAGTAKYFDNIDNAFTGALSAENSGCTLTLYKDCELSQNIVIGNATLTVDVNGHSISPEIRGIDVNDGGVLYLKNSGENGSIGLEMAVNKGGTLINGTADDSSSAVSLFAVTADAAECVEFYGGSCTYLTIKNGTSGIALYGGYYDIICGSLTDNTPVNDLLAKGYAFATLNSVTHLPESIVDGSVKTIGGRLTNVMVVAHEHRYNVETGKCPCGVCALAIFTETTQSSETYTFIESETQFKNIAENEADGVLKLTGDVDCIVKGIIINGNKTIDMNGHTLNVSVGTEEISAVAVYGNVTFENSGSSRAVINAIGVYSYGMVTVNGDIEFDTFATFEDGDALINAGVFKSIYVQGRSVIEILGSGKALASESGEILNASVQQIYKAGDNIFVTAHPKHTYDDHGNCACGYKCLHDGEGQVNEDSANKVCSECGAKIYAKVTTADGKVKYFDDITEGLRYADKAENKGCVFTLVTSGKINSGVTLSNGQFTITTSNYGTIYDYNQTITIDGADVIAEGYMFIKCKVNVKSGSLTLPEGSSAGFDSIAISGGTVTVSEGVNVDNNAGADNLFVSEDAIDAKLTIGGGTYGRIVLGQFKLKDVIASGVRVISYDNPTDPTAEKTAKALLYSDIAEKNNFDSENNTVSYYLFTKCEHKNEDGSYAFNEGGICKYCNSEFAASVSYTVDGSAKTELFGDIYDAFDKANEIGTATVTLCRDIADSEIAHEINVTGNLALELNTKTLGATDKAKKIYICGSTLTVNGNGKVWSAIEAKPDSKLTITNGEYNDVYALSDSEVVILDGIIDCLSVYGTGKAEVSGGKFKYLFMYNGKAIESVLADGYAYKNADGTWLSIDEREKDSYLGGSIGALSVEEAPIKSASIAWVGEEAPVIYRNGEKYLYVDITYELAVGSRGATYSDFVNGNNRIKDYNLYNKYMVHCYEIGKLAAKDGEVEYYIVLKCNGYEYKSNVLKLTLATCSHPKDSFSYENDGFVICGICDALIEAEVVDADGKSLGYADIESAIKLAQENEGSTVKLMSEGVSESVTVTGGRFTVDFNGKKVFYQFDVNGGDVTFTSSVKQADVETLISGIEVNGTDAKVTIDGKIKLGSVTLTSGALAVNSAESYIKELSINGGKTVVNGANIDALKANGGDTVINYVTADSLSVNINGSGSISIVTGEFGSTTCKTDSGYTLGMAIASGSVVFGNNINGFTVYTYDAIQTMTKTDRIFVEKCSHKDGNGSYVLDGNPCPYCNEEIVATVSYTANGGEETDLFSDIYDAFDKANEIGTATVTLQKNITDDITDTIAVTGNVTLELNGKRLSQPGTDVWYSIEVTSGKLTVNGSGLIKRVAVCNGSDAEINGGTLSDFIIKDGGNAVIKGGQFYSLQVSGKGRNVGQLLADGYAYWSFIDSGIWSTIAEREKQDIANVEVRTAPIKSATITANDESPIIYRNGKKASTFAADVTYSGNETLYITGCLIDGTVISEKTELLNGYCYLLGDQVDKVVAEDGEIQYYCIFTYDGYDYKSNVVTLTVATCQHPVESVKCDDNGCVCGICNRALTASVELSDGTLSYYENWNDAIGAAEESEGCTLKLLNYSLVNNNETFDISKGRFTVDLNKNDGNTAFAFDVKGGDITFTASQAASSSLTGVTVSGENANVLIDSKATLNYLVVNSGKVSADGANIGAITINGGDTVINDVNADYLSMKADTTGGSGYNVSIVSGTFNIFTCENESNYTLGRAIASGSRVIGLNAIVGSGFKYAEIQSMTKANYLNVIKCDHKDENDSYALDGNLCPYCNEEIVATVSYTANGGEETDLFSDIYDAFDKANEIGTATVTLQKNITDDITDTIAVTGNVTLELNGKRLSQPGTDVWYSIEVTSGKLTVNGSGLIKRVAVCNGSDAEINGGTLSDFIIKDGGNAVIKGGQFYSLQVSGKGRNVGQLLADGYAYWSFIDSGIWSTIAEREKQDIANVEVRTAPIKSATATANKTVLYRNGGGARQILFNFNVNTSDGYTISDANKVTVGLYVGDTLIRELDFVGNSYTFANADEISDTDGTVKAHLVITLNGYEYVTNDVEFEMATCTHPYDALTTDEYDYYRCSLCDASINAILVKTNGDKACYTDNVPEAFEAAQLEENNGCTLELYRGVNRDCEITQGSFTVLFKKTGSASAVIKVSGGNVKITGDDGCTLSKYPGSSVGYLIAVTGGTVTFDDITINDDSISVSGGKTVINGGTYNKLSVSGGTVTINSGTFSSIDVSAEGKALKDLLGENKAFTTSDGKLFDASKVSESDMSLTVIDHSKHEYDETGRCGCGYQCAHSEINAEGVCNECNAKMYVAVTVKSETGTTVKYFTKLTEAFEFAAKNENKGCTLKMLRDFFDRNTDINVNGGELTVDMNGFGVYINSFNGSGTQITIRSDSKCTFGVENGFSMDGGTVTFSGEVSVVCQNVKLNATYFSSYVETLKIDTLILEDGVLLKQLASITNANIANIDCSSEIYLYQILASGSRVDSQLYSDLKANASSNFDNVRIIRCDHPDGVGRDNRCIYCNSLIAASVSYTENGAEKTEYFVKEDLGKAFAKANSVASATITMLMSSAYDTDYLPVTGDVTLIANGDNAILYNTVKVADGGKLTLRGNANIFAVIAEPGSRLTAEEATRIAYLTVNGGDVKLSGGQYDNITVKDGKITDILGNGYAYKKTEGGAWLTLKEREVSEASGVTVAKAPIVQATLSTEINKLYRNSNANPTLKFNLTLANGSNLNDSYVSKRYGINSYVSGDIIYSSLSALVKDAKLSADEIIDKAGNSVAAKIYFVVITDDGYEIKSNTVSIDLVDCDHSQVVDPTADKETAGNITEPTYCEICESKFNAKITKGDDVRYYNNLDEAAKDAQKSENEGCTLYPLYNKNGYGGQLVITEGNFTLKYAVRTAFSRPIIINGKAKLTVTGRCAVTAFENQDAFIVRGGDVTFDGLATGSDVTINGGNVTMAANNINCLTINGGNVSISSGGFAKIVTTVSDKVIADYIDHGFWVQDRGTKEWIDIYSLNKATASSTNGLTVRLCPMQIIKPIDTVYYTNGYYPGDIPSLQINAEPWYSNEVDAKVAYQWIAIDENGYETVIEGATDRKLSLENLTTGRYYCRLTYSNAATAGVSMKSDVVTATITECEHSGGEATCTEKAKCEICGAEYGEPLGHDYVVIKVVEPDYRNEGYSVFECTRCKDSYIGNRVPVKPIPDVEEIAVEKTTYNEVDISWKNISGVDGYYVECYVGNQWKQINCSADGDRVAAKLSGLSAGLKYKVRIAAYAGRFTAKFRCFYVDTVPSPVWNINTVKATDETVRISWSRNARADGYKVEWYINNQWSVKTVTGNNNISAVIDGLCAGTRYKVRVSAYKGDLYSPYTYGYIDTLPSKVTGITQTVTSSSFTLKWDKNESADGYTVQYYADGKWNEKTLTGNKKTTVTIGSLKGYKTYKVRIKAYKGELESAFDDIYITTAPTKVSGLKVKSAVDSKAVVIWNADANADGYNVEYYIGGKWVEKTITDNKTAMAVLGGLTPYITYKVRVRAYKDNLYGDYSYTTVTAVLSPVTNIKVVSAKSNSITVKWGKNASADGYKVEIYKGGKWVKKTLKGSTNATVTIGGLRAGSVYKVRIASYKGANTSTYTYANVKTAK